MINNEEQKYINWYATELRTTADKDYIASRSMYKLNLDEQFFWYAQQCIEKYLKIILLFNGISIKLFSHDLVKLYNEITELNIYKIKKDENIIDWLNIIYNYGMNRYKINSYSNLDFNLAKFDLLVYYVRQFCRSPKNIIYKKIDIDINFIDRNDKKDIFDGYLEKVLNNNKKLKKQYDTLIWKNLYFGNRKKSLINLETSYTVGNSLLFREKEAFLVLKDYIKMNKNERNYYDYYHNNKN